MSIMLRTYDLLIILAVLAGMAFAGLRAARGKGVLSPVEYFLARRDIGWLPLGASLFVTTIWGYWSLILARPVMPGVLGWLLPGFVVVVILVVLAFGFVAPYRALDVMSVPSFLSQRFGKHVGTAAALASVVLTLFIHIPFTIMIGTRLVHALLGWDPMSTGLLMVVIPGLFVVAGGCPATIAAQSAGSLAGAVGLLFLAVYGFPGGNAVLRPLLPEAVGSWIPLMLGVTILGLWSLTTEQQVVQRLFASRSSAQGRAGALAAAAMVLAGVLAVTAGFEGPLSRSTGTNGAGIAGGFIGAAVLAFGMASLSGHFMSVATVLTMDIVRPVRNAAADAVLVLAGRLTSSAVVILAILTASSLALMGQGVLDWMVPAVVIVAPPMLAVVALGLFWPRMHGRGALWALVGGWITGVVQVSSVSGSEAQLFQGAAAACAVSFIICITVSLAVGPLGTLRKVPETVLQVRKP